MKVAYDERYREVYSSDPAAMLGRMEGIYEELRGDYEFFKPEPATEEDLRLVHEWMIKRWVIGLFLRL